MESPSDFLPIIVHQLRAPLIGVRWSLDSLIKEDLGPLNADQKADLEKCRSNIDRLMSTIKDILAMNNEHANAYTFSPVELNITLHDCIKELKAEADKKHITLALRGIDIPMPPIHADASKISIVFENLLENAIKYTPQNGTITLSVVSEETGVHLSITDTGIGIPAKDQGLIFTRFFRAGNAIALDPHGSGIGLYIAKHIVDAHQGKIWFESAPDTGATFHITLPYSPKVS